MNLLEKARTIMTPKNRLRGDPFYRGDRWVGFWEFLNNIAEEDLAQDMRTLPGGQALKILPQSFFWGSQFRDFAAEFRQGISEVHRHTLYHYRAYAAAGYTERIFFNENIGSAANGLADTNLQVAGQMSGSESMLAQYIRVHFIPDPADYDVAAASAGVSFGEGLEILQDRSYLEFKIADKPYITGGPLLLFPAAMGPGTVNAGSIVAGGQRGISYPNNGSPDNRALYLVDPPLGILPNRSFSVTLRWTAAQTVTTAGTTRLGVLLDGYRIRAIQ